MESANDDKKNIQIARWANLNPDDTLCVDGSPKPFQMCNSDGTGLPLLKYLDFGADIIRFGANEGVRNHTHVGDHILIVIKGGGVVVYDGIEHDLNPGVCYLIPGDVEHAIKARSELVMIAIGNNHQPLDSEERMTPIL